MKRTSRRGPLPTLVACTLSLAVAASAGASRTEAVLSWDDGIMDSYSHMVTGFPGQKIAVRFQAPE